VTSKGRTASEPRCIVIAGPNGAGKTTFAREFLPKQTDIVQFVNADFIAGGLSALKPQIAAIAAGRVFLSELERLARDRTSRVRDDAERTNLCRSPHELDSVRLSNRNHVPENRFASTRAQENRGQGQAGRTRCPSRRRPATLQA